MPTAPTTRPLVRRAPAWCAGMLLALAASACGGDKDDLTVEQLPAPVREALLAAAKGAPLTDIERETEDGKPAYSAEFVDADGKTEVEVTVAEDGTVLKTEREPADADDVARAKPTAEAIPGQAPATAR